MPSLKDVRQKYQDNQAKKLTVTPYRYAYLGDGRGLATSNMFAPGDSGSNTLFARNTPQDSIFFPILNRNAVVPQFNLPVVIGYKQDEPRSEQILGVHIGGLGTMSVSNVPVLGPHHHQHEWGGGDTVFSDGPQFKPGLLCPTVPASMQVQILSFVYFWDIWRQFPTTTTADLSGYKPASGFALYLLITLDPVLQALVYRPGPVFAPSLNPFNLTATFDNVPTPTGTEIPIGFVGLNSSTSVVDWSTINDSISDARLHLGMPLGNVLDRLRQLEGDSGNEPNLSTTGAAASTVTDSNNRIAGLIDVAVSGITDKQGIIFDQATNRYLPGIPRGNTLPVFNYSNNTVSSPPTDLELNGTFGLPSTAGSNFIGYINSSGSYLREYLTMSDGYNWWTVAAAKAVSALGTTVTILLADSFTAANGTSLSGRALDTGGNWTQQSGTWSVTNNNAVQGSGAGTYVLTSVGVANSNIRAIVGSVNNSGSYFGGVVFRFTDTSNYWVAGIANSAVYLRKVVAGVSTDLDYNLTFPTRYQTWMTIEVTANGNNVSAIFDGGWGLSATDSFNNSATAQGIFEQRGGGYNAMAFDDFQSVNLPAYPWTRVGTIISANSQQENNVSEPTVLYDTYPQILTGTNIFKLWYTGGWFNTHIYYAESLDGITWTQRSTPVLLGIRRSTVLKDNGTYYLYGTPDDVSLNLYTSYNGLDWTLDTATVLTVGTAGTWDDSHISNSFVWKEGPNDWRMIYDGDGSGSPSLNYYCQGYATSTDGRTWTKSGSNPVIGLGTLAISISGPFVIKVGGFYYLYLQISPPGSNVPTYITRYRSTNLTSWTQYPLFTTIPRVGSAEGATNYLGQTADPSIVVVGQTAYMFFEADSDGTQQTGAEHLILATANLNAIGGY